MSDFQQPEILATFDRSWKSRDGEGSKSERLQLERGEYKGYATFTLRVAWQAEDGSWRWAAARPSQSGKCWQSLNLKARELRELGEALIQAAADTGEQRVGPPRQQRRQTPPREQRELAKFDAAGKVPKDFDDSELPF